MAFGTTRVNINVTATEELLNSPDGPVGVLIEELSQKATEIARAAAPVMERHNYSRWGKVFDERYQYGPPGHTKGDIRVHFPAFNKLGQLYGGVNAPYGPTLFLEHPARQIHSVQYMFMTEALNGVEL